MRSAELEPSECGRSFAREELLPCYELGTSLGRLFSPPSCTGETCSRTPSARRLGCSGPLASRRCRCLSSTQPFATSRSLSRVDECCDGFDLNLSKRISARRTTLLARRGAGSCDGRRSFAESGGAIAQTSLHLCASSFRQEAERRRRGSCAELSPRRGRDARRCSSSMALFLPLLSAQKLRSVKWSSSGP
ncbi:hypothetical protein BCR35DRAFT_43482 [Leucosporidium creatinivorum]|uniref:Uncharacterized protein n=1 Tax=Leucosporidium creatinivorum TaxID=106004 RepID=A0A1Y2FRJ5_9BASI|nr:hypothetical protein BCR35DRAFT_43482 [Leucosporidium creatinivorum]